MKSYAQLMEELRADIAQDEVVAEQTVHLVPHGNKGTHFKVVKGIKGQLDAGEVIHDSHVDDLHDIGIKTKILKEEEMTNEELEVFDGEDLNEALDPEDEEELPDLEGTPPPEPDSEDEQIDELSQATLDSAGIKRIRQGKDGRKIAFGKATYGKPKPVSEDEEQLDELSHKTLDRYTEKSIRSLSSHMAAGKANRVKGMDADEAGDTVSADINHIRADDHEKTASNRSKGIGLATSKRMNSGGQKVRVKASGKPVM